MGDEEERFIANLVIKKLCDEPTKPVQLICGKLKSLENSKTV
jgi:hypothetical protein